MRGHLTGTCMPALHVACPPRERARHGDREHHRLPEEGRRRGGARAGGVPSGGHPRGRPGARAVEAAAAKYETAGAVAGTFAVAAANMECYVKHMYIVLVPEFHLHVAKMVWIARECHDHDHQVQPPR